MKNQGCAQILAKSWIFGVEEGEKLAQRRLQVALRVHPIKPKLLSDEQRAELAHYVGSTGRPLSEIIIEEREGR